MNTHQAAKTAAYSRYMRKQAKTRAAHRAREVGK